MDSTIIVKYAIIAGLAAISGFLLVGFFIYSTYAAILWLKEKKSKEKIWDGLIFVITFPRIYPIIIEAIDKIFRRFL
mgnify:CR=1 FL=1